VNHSRSNPLKEAALLVVGVAVVGGLLLVLLGVAVDLLLPRLPVSVEMRLFRPLWGSVAEVGADEPRLRPLQSLLDRLASQWPDNPYHFRLGLIDEEAPNAFAVPGGAILITSGLLEEVESENELAFVLGHEIGHFRHRDHLRRLGRGLLFGWMAAKVGGGATPVQLIEQITLRGFDRQQEAAADRFGLALVQATYGHVAGALDFFHRLPEAGVGGELAAYFGTHPVTEARIAALRDLARARGWPLTGPLLPLPPAVSRDHHRRGKTTEDTKSTKGSAS